MLGVHKDNVREARPRWFGRVKRKNSEYIGRRMLEMELQGRRRGGSFLDVVKEDMQSVGVTVRGADEVKADHPLW